MKVSVAIFMFLFMSLFSIAQSPKELFEKGNAAYNLGEYQNAIAYYHQILESGFHSPDVYYNLGNSYYRMGEVGESVFYLEKARQLDLKNEAILTNLNFAKNMSLDAIEPLPQTFFYTFGQNVFYSFSLATWGLILKAFAWLLALLFGLYFWSSRVMLKRILFSAFWVVMVLFVSVFSLTYSENKRTELEKPAIIFEGQVNIREEPNNRSEVLFILHEGTKVLVLDKLDVWNKIRIDNGSEGWIDSSTLKLLN